jgi:hypothetical protein
MSKITLSEMVTDATLKLYDGQTGELLADFSNNLATGERGGTIFNYGRVPASALPAEIDFNNKPSKERIQNNAALRSKTYIAYLMEEP